MTWLTLLLAAMLVVAAATPAQAAPATTSPPAWGTPGAFSGPGLHPTWAYESCAGEFVSSDVTVNSFVWGGEQSCTESSPQTLEIILENVTQGGDSDVATPYKSWTGYQNYIHVTSECQSTKKTLYREYAYGTANGVNLQPFPATKGFYLNCYVPGNIKGGCSGIKTTPLNLSTSRVAAVKPDC